MGRTWIRRTLYILLGGGMLLQAAATTSCADTVGPIIAQAAVSLILQMVLGGVAT